MTQQLVNDSYIKQVKLVVDQIYPEDQEQASVYRDTTLFFINDAKSTRDQLDLKIQIAALQDTLAESKNEGSSAELDALIDRLEATKKADATNRHTRLNRVRGLCSQIFDLCEGDSLADSQQKTAKFLAALWLLSEQHIGGHQSLNQRLKAPYKLALTLRFVDPILSKNLAKVPNWESFSNPEIRFDSDPEKKKQ